MTHDTLDLDDVWLTGGWLCFGNCQNDGPWCRNVSSRPSGGLIADFETLSREITPFGTSWYAFDDRECGGTSQVTDGATFDSLSQTYRIDWVGNSGFGDDGYGAAAVAEFGAGGRKYPRTGDTLVLLPYAGIACDLYDSATATYLDLERGVFGLTAFNPARSIRFDYRTDEVYRLTLEIFDINDVPDRIRPDERESRGAGVAWCHELCTSPVWKSVEIPFDSLHLRSDCPWCIPVPFDRSAVAKIRFKAEGKKGTGGMVQIDNVCFPPPVALHAPAADRPQVARKPALCASYRNGIITIGLPAGMGNPDRTLHLLDPRGRVVAAKRLVGGEAVAAINLAGKIAADGLYFVRLVERSSRSNGQPQLLSAPITIVR